jgi:uncharacterized protein
LLEASIGLVTINSLINIEESKCTDKNAYEILAEKGEGKNVAVVGPFPWIPKLKEKIKNLWVLEQNLREGDLPAEEAKNILPLCAVVGITGTAFINHTLEDLLHLRKGAFVVLIGPTPPFSPFSLITAWMLFVGPRWLMRVGEFVPSAGVRLQRN